MTAPDPGPEVAEVVEVQALLGSRPPTLGPVRLLCLDGPSGSGKSTLAARLADAGPAVRVLRTDDLYDGWDGLPRVADQLAPLLADLAAGRPAGYRRYDWPARRFAEWVPVPRPELLVLDGVGSGSRALASWCTVLVWLEAPEPVRRRRALARDGDDFAPYWDAWADAERAHFATEDTRARADLVLRRG